MKTGDSVIYADSQGVEHLAHLDAVVGTGPSLYKVVDLTYGEGQHRKSVPHQLDAGRRAYWREMGPGVVTPIEVPADGAERETELEPGAVPGGIADGGASHPPDAVELGE